MSIPKPPLRRILSRTRSLRESRYIADALRTETVGGGLLLVAALAAIIWMNSPAHASYQALREAVVGPASWHLDLSLGQWAADGLLAIFFLVAGIELKREFVAGDLRDPAKAALPIAAAACGVALPAILFFTYTKAVGANDVLAGWAIPTATDIAFALAVLAVIGTHLPSALRSFLLTLAVVDDLIAIIIIAVFYSNDLHLGFLALATIPLAVWVLLTRRRVTHPLVLAVPAVITWGLVHASGIHATVAGVLLGLTIRVNREAEDDPDRHSYAERMEHALRPFSAGVAVPVFAFFAAGVRVVGTGISEVVGDPVFIGVVLGLVVGKCIGIFGGTWLVSRFTNAELDEDLSWIDVLGLSLLAGVGFTVSLLIGDLAFGPGSPHDDHVKAAVLAGSLLAATMATVVLRTRNRHYARIEAAETADSDGDGIPDIYEDDESDRPEQGNTARGETPPR